MASENFCQIVKDRDSIRKRGKDPYNIYEAIRGTIGLVLLYQAIAFSYIVSTWIELNNNRLFKTQWDFAFYCSR